MKKEKSTVIGHLAAQMAAYELHKSKKTERLNEAIKICEDIIVIRDQIEFSKDFESYLFKEYVLQSNFKGLDKGMFNNMFQSQTSKLRSIQKQFDMFGNIDLNSKTAPCFDIVITSEFHHSIYYQLLEICKVMNQQPKLTKLFFNSTNQFSNCMNYCGIKIEVEINANWIIQQGQ